MHDEIADSYCNSRISHSRAGKCHYRFALSLSACDYLSLLASKCHFRFRDSSYRPAPGISSLDGYGGNAMLPLHTLSFDYVQAIGEGCNALHYDYH